MIDSFEKGHSLSPGGPEKHGLGPRVCMTHQAVQQSFETVVCNCLPFLAQAEERTVVWGFGAGAELAKCDIKSAFRLLPVYPNDFQLLRFLFDSLFLWVVHWLFYFLFSV